MTFPDYLRRTERMTVAQFHGKDDDTKLDIHAGWLKVRHRPDLWEISGYVTMGLVAVCFGAIAVVLTRGLWG